MYCMVHATFQPKGRRLMKDVMHRQGANGNCAYLGPQDQIARLQGTLIPIDPIPMLKTELPAKFAHRTLSFDDLRDQCCDDDELRDPEYRAALKVLRDEEKIVVTPVTL